MGDAVVLTAVDTSIVALPDQPSDLVAGWWHRQGKKVQCVGWGVIQATHLGGWGGNGRVDVAIAFVLAGGTGVVGALEVAIGPAV